MDDKESGPQEGVCWLVAQQDKVRVTCRGMRVLQCLNVGWSCKDQRSESEEKGVVKTSWGALNDGGLW